jgi:hypothetical protein
LNKELKVMPKSPLADKVSQIIAEHEAALREELLEAQRRISELEQENEKLREQPHGRRSLLDEITDAALKEQLAPLFKLDPLRLDMVIREAGIALEHKLRTESGADSRLYGVELVDAVLKPQKPMITFSSHRGEQEGARMLYRGAMQFIRNPPMHRPMKYAEDTARLFIRLIDSLLLLLPKHEPSQPEDPLLNGLYERTNDTRVRRLAEELVAQILRWDPRVVSAKPTKHAISIQVSGRLIAYLRPQKQSFAIQTRDSRGKMTTYRVATKHDVESVLPLVRENYERSLPGGEPLRTDEESVSNRYQIITNPRVRELAQGFVAQIQEWDPDRIVVKPTKYDISIQVPGRNLAYLKPRRSAFSIQTKDAGGKPATYPIHNQAGVDSVLPLVRTNYEKLMREREPASADVEQPPPKHRHIDRATFLSRCSPLARAFFEKVLYEAQQRDMILYWGTKGFSVRIQLEDRISVMYGFPRCDFQVYTGDWPISEEERSDLHRRVREVAPFRPRGQYTHTLQVDEETEHLAYEALDFWWNEVERMVAAAD